MKPGKNSAGAGVRPRKCPHRWSGHGLRGLARADGRTGEVCNERIFRFEPSAAPNGVAAIARSRRGGSTQIFDRARRLSAKLGKLYVGRTRARAPKLRRVLMPVGKLFGLCFLVATELFWRASESMACT